MSAKTSTEAKRHQVLGGHSDLTAGAVAITKAFVDRVRQIAVFVGATLAPAAACLHSRGIRTLDLRET